MRPKPRATARPYPVACAPSTATRPFARTRVWKSERRRRPRWRVAELPTPTASGVSRACRTHALARRGFRNARTPNAGTPLRVVRVSPESDARARRRSGAPSSCWTGMVTASSRYGGRGCSGCRSTDFSRAEFRRLPDRIGARACDATPALQWCVAWRWRGRWRSRGGREEAVETGKNGTPPLSPHTAMARKTRKRDPRVAVNCTHQIRTALAPWRALAV